MAQNTNSDDQYIYLTISNQFGLGLFDDIRSGTYTPGERQEFASYCQRKIFETDLTALTGETAERVKKALDAGRPVPVDYYGGDHSAVYFQGNGPKVIEALKTVFANNADLIISTPVVALHDEWHKALGKGLGKTELLVTVPNGIGHYMQKHGIKEWAP